MTRRSLAKEIDALLDDWRADPDLTGPEETLIYIQSAVDRYLGRKERRVIDREDY